MIERRLLRGFYSEANKAIAVRLGGLTAGEEPTMSRVIQRSSRSAAIMRAGFGEIRPDDWRSSRTRVVVEFVKQIVALKQEMTSKYFTSGSYGRINVGGNEIGG